MSDKLKPYCVTKGKPAFDWNAFLAKDCYFHTQEELAEAERLSCSWITCACGNACSVLPRNELGRPVDPQLSDLGNDFYEAISGMKGSQFHGTPINKQEALSILAQIEARSAHLLAEMGRKEL